MRPLALACFALLPLGCLPDLPPGWEGARPVDVTQTECAGSPYEDHDERVEFSTRPAAVRVDYREAHFRCAQDVEAFFVLEGDGLDVLVQPVDMNPQAVAACDCLYDISLVVDGVPAGPRSTTVFRRWDNLNAPNDPIEVGHASVDVP